MASESISIIFSALPTTPCGSSTAGWHFAITANAAKIVQNKTRSFAGLRSVKVLFLYCVDPGLLCRKTRNQDFNWGHRDGFRGFTISYLPHCYFWTQHQPDSFDNYELANFNNRLFFSKLLPVKLLHTLMPL